MLLDAQLLVPENHDEVVEERQANLADDLVVEVSAEIDAAEFGTERAAEGLSGDVLVFHGPSLRWPMTDGRGLREVLRILGVDSGEVKRVAGGSHRSVRSSFRTFSRWKM